MKPFGLLIHTYSTDLILVYKNIAKIDKVNSITGKTIRIESHSGLIFKSQLLTI